eukprot:TRINITY_DN16191_c0_g1_i1.p3 TRINITY_DN16191_c0_g1~~TRINITY_DN16191_c0_g1_i1.p3  ORF type:complete len:122 (-),score=24.70 TRINITY_DN16191_c0_g1_i1:118-483(-)
MGAHSQIKIFGVQGVEFLQEHEREWNEVWKQVVGDDSIWEHIAKSKSANDDVFQSELVNTDLFRAGQLIQWYFLNQENNDGEKDIFFNQIQQKLRENHQKQGLQQLTLEIKEQALLSGAGY